MEGVYTQRLNEATADHDLQEGIPFKRGKSGESVLCKSATYRGWRTHPFLRGAAFRGKLEEWRFGRGKPLGGGLELAKSKRNGATEVFRIGVGPLKPRFWSGFSGPEMN
jgi:hypothetical protein